MITEAIINLMMFLPEKLIEMLPELEFTIPKVVNDNILNVLKGVAWVFPTVLLLPLFASSLAVDMAKIVMAIIARVKSFIPFMGT
ncbi:MAG: hypothetical protein FWG70_01050 [Oscillospiraceae bacterium]|nr:hypothetical protein [Oscillospiraceae bacterium]